jgi:hypothetical protein
MKEECIIGWNASHRLAFSSDAGRAYAERGYSYDYLPHAVSFIENTNELISGEKQQITHTRFNKVSTINEKVGADNYQKRN